MQTSPNSFIGSLELIVLTKPVSVAKAGITSGTEDLPARSFYSELLFILSLAFFELLDQVLHLCSVSEL